MKTVRAQQDAEHYGASMRGNSFDALRLLAASVVLFGHSLNFTTPPSQTMPDPMYSLFGVQAASATLAVMAFFVMSGYLITGSWERTRDWRLFLWARFLRLYPALTVVVLLIMFVLGPLATNDAGYWAEPQTWDYLGNLTLHNSLDRLTLPGVFDHNPRQDVDGSIWTLEYEVACYLGVLFLGALRLLTRESAAALALMLVGVVWRIPEAVDQPWLYMPAAFATGAALYQWREQIPWRRDYALLSVLMTVFVGMQGHLLAATASFGAYALLYVARGSRFAGWGRWGDASYGIYLLNMPVLQVLISLLGLHPWIVGPVAFVIVLPLAFLLWHVVESPALQLRQSLSFPHHSAPPAS